MRRFDIWAGKGSHEGTCHSCRAEVLVIDYPMGEKVQTLCFVCACLPPVRPDQLAIVNIISSLFYELRLPKKPPKPKQPKLMKRNKGTP